MVPFLQGKDSPMLWRMPINFSGAFQDAQVRQRLVEIRLGKIPSVIYGDPVHGIHRAKDALESLLQERLTGGTDPPFPQVLLAVTGAGLVEPEEVPEFAVSRNGLRAGMLLDCVQGPAQGLGIEELRDGLLDPGLVRREGLLDLWIFCLSGVLHHE